MKKTIFSLLMTLSMLTFTASIQAEALQLPAIVVEPIQDSATQRQYELYIKVPEDYDATSDKIHPVIYIVDALWNMEVISGSIEYFVKDAILVGISWEKGMRPQRSRMRDYTPVKYEKYKAQTGQAQDHLRFIQNDVFTFVENHYKTDPKRRTYYGFSVGGTFGTYILLNHTDTFKNYIIGSPSTYAEQTFSHEYAPHQLNIPEKIQANVFLSVGEDEQDIYVEHAFSLKRFLQARKADGMNVAFSVIQDADHGRAFPLSTLASLGWLSDLLE